MLTKCKICCHQSNCIVCGFRLPKKEETLEEKAHREYMEYLEHVFAKLRRAQAITSGSAELDAEVIKYIGRWYDAPRPLYVSPIKELYDEAFLAEKRGDRNQARALYKKLAWKMTEDDRIHYRIRKADIEAKVKELSK